MRSGFNCLATFAGRLVSSGSLMIFAISANVHVRPSADGGGAQNEAGEDAGRSASGGGRLGLVEIGIALQQAHHALAEIELLGKIGRVPVIVSLLARADLSDGVGAIHDAVGPGAIDVEEANGFVGQQVGMRHKVFEGHADEHAQVSQETLHVRRHARYGAILRHLLLDVHADAEQFLSDDQRLSHREAPGVVRLR